MSNIVREKRTDWRGLLKNLLNADTETINTDENLDKTVVVLDPKFQKLLLESYSGTLKKLEEEYTVDDTHEIRNKKSKREVVKKVAVTSKENSKKLEKNSKKIEKEITD